MSCAAPVSPMNSSHKFQHLTVKTLMGKRLKRPNVMCSARITNELKPQVAKILNSRIQHTCSLLKTNARVLNHGVDNGHKDGDADLEEDVQRQECLSSKLTKAFPNVHDLLRIDLSDGHSGCGRSEAADGTEDDEAPSLPFFSFPLLSFSLRRNGFVGAFRTDDTKGCCRKRPFGHWLSGAMQRLLTEATNSTSTHSKFDPIQLKDFQLTTDCLFTNAPTNNKHCLDTLSSTTSSFHCQQATFVAEFVATR